MLERIRIAVLMGGPSAEHDVSLRSGEMVVRHLDRKKYGVARIVISRRGKWPLSFSKLKKQCDLAFIAMHGEYGEDGTLQRLLDQHGIRYTGSGARASRLGMDKPRSYPAFRRAGLTVAPYRMMQKRNYRLSYDRIIDGIPLGVVVKPADRGSSVGLTIVKRKVNLRSALRRAFAFSRRAIVQQYIPGREVTCGILERNGIPRPLPPTEIVPMNRLFFDYHAKYTPGATQEITPARFPGTMLKKIQRAALAAHRAIGASGYSRSDFIIDETRSSAEGGSASGGKNQRVKLYILEINTLPGLTKGSLLPKAARAAGIPFPRLLDAIVEAGMRRATSH